jgi:tetratricopeptide (TPR) repeat protein
VRRLALIAGLVALVSGAGLLAQHLKRDREYQSLMSAGDKALEAGHADDAIAAYSLARALRPDSMAAYLRRGEAYRHIQRDDAAIRDLREASRLGPSATQPLEIIGDIFDAQNLPTQASDYYGRAVQIDGQNPALLYKLALARYRSGEPAAAIDPLRRAIGQNDSFGEAHYLLGLVLRDTQDVAGAIAALEHAIRVAPTLVAPREELAELYRAQGRPVEEIAALQALATIDHQPDRSVAIALAEARHGEYDDAVATLSALAAGSPHDATVQLALGRVYLARAERRLDRTAVRNATVAIGQALGTGPKSSEALALFGRALYLSGDDEGAERLLREAIATQPVDLEAFGYLADACQGRGHLADAREALAKLDALEGDTVGRAVRAARLRRLGLLCLQTADAAAALAYLRDAVDEGLRDAATYAALADAARRSSQADLARESLAKGLAIDPRQPELLRLQKIIR